MHPPSNPPPRRLSMELQPSATLIALGPAEHVMNPLTRGRVCTKRLPIAASESLGKVLSVSLLYQFPDRRSRPWEPGTGGRGGSGGEARRIGRGPSAATGPPRGKRGDGEDRD